MVGCNSSRTPVDAKFKLGDGGHPILDPMLYRSVAGSLKILRYVRGTLDYGLQLFSSSTTDLVAYSDANWAEAEYRGVANVVAETCWLRNLLRELHTPLSSVTLVYCDDASVRVLHVPSRYQYANIFTKDLPSALFEEFRTSLSVWCPSL
ncbi:ribonuclease H-like domain-containing protein [Tanacetum coccineum]